MPQTLPQKQEKLAIFGIPLLCTLLVFSMISLSADLFQDWENKTLDYRFKLRESLPVSSKIVLIDIDDQSISAIGRWPWNRTIHAEMIDILSKSGAAVIGYDILFNQKASETEDASLETAIKKAGNLYLPTGFELALKPSASPLLTVEREIGPLPRLQNAAAGIGHISSNRDPDGTIRKVPLLVNNAEKEFPAFAITLLQGYFQNTQTTKIHSAQNEIMLQTEKNQNIIIPVNNLGMMRINYAGPWVSTFSHYPFVDILAAWKDPKNRQDLKKTFEGKILLVSNTATGYDLKPIPIEADYPGGGIHANIINTILTGQYLREPGAILKFGLSFFVSLMISTLLFLKKGRSVVPLGLSLALVYLVLTYFLFLKGINLPVLFPILTIILTSVSSLLYQNKMNTREMAQLTEEKNLVSEKFQTAATALKSKHASLVSEKNTLAQMMIKVHQAKGAEKTHRRQMGRLRENLEKSKKEQSSLTQEKKVLKKQVDQFTVAKIKTGSSLHEPFETLRKEAETHGLITKNHSLLKGFADLKKTVKSSLPILILGETGTGKERIAQIVHAMNATKKALVTVNLPAIPPTLFESTLFGYVKGAFNDARSDRPGKFQEADGGTLFLDEIGEIPPEMQAKLLRAIETGEIDRVGATRPDHVKLKIVAATHRRLDDEIQNKRFRSDLFFRLSGITINIPPLRERKEDLEALTYYFLERFTVGNGTENKTLSKDALAKIKTHDWPGNVRELKDRIEKALALSDAGAVISAADLGLDHTEEKTPTQAPGSTQIDSILPRVAVTLPQDKDLSDTDFLQVLRENNFDKTQTGRQLGPRSMAVGSRFRGICLKTFNEHERDLKKAAQALCELGEDTTNMENMILKYHNNLIRSVQRFKNKEEAVKRCKTVLFKNIKMKYRDHMIALVQHYFDSLGRTKI